MNNPSHTTRARLLLTELRTLLRDFAKQEDSLTRDIRQRRSSLEYRFTQELDRLTQMVDERASSFSQAHQDAEASILASHQARETKILLAHQAAIRSLPRRAQLAREKWLGEVQHQRFRADRAHTSRLRTTDTSLASARKSLAETHEQITQLLAHTQRAFSGCPSFLPLLSHPAPQEAGDPDHLAQWNQHLADTLQSSQDALHAFRALALPRFLAAAPVPVQIPLAALLSSAGLLATGPTPLGLGLCGGILTLLLAAIFTLRIRSTSLARPAATALADALLAARSAHHACALTTEAWHARETARIEDEFAQRSAELDARWARAEEIESAFIEKGRAKLDTQLPRTHSRNALLTERARETFASNNRSPLDAVQAQAAGRRTLTEANRERERATLNSEEAQRWEDLTTRWTTEFQSRHRALVADADLLRPLLLPWDPAEMTRWQPASQFPTGLALGSLLIDLTPPGEPRPTDPRLALQDPAQLEFPITLEFPAHGSLLVECAEPGSPAVAALFNHAILRLLSTLPPGKFTCTLFDPVGLGQSFAGLMHLADYEESLINRRIWTQRDQIDARLEELSEHIEKVIQMYLRDEYPTITDYNAQAGSVSEKYHFLVLADFPTELGDTAAKRLQSILASGPRCGVFTLLHWDPRQPLPDGLNTEDLRSQCLCLHLANGLWSFSGQPLPTGCSLQPTAPPDPAAASDLLHRIGRASVDSNRVQVPFTQIAPPSDALWTTSTSDELRVPVGRTGATKHQFFALGKGTRQHALLAGKTGSGKSTLLHVLITNLALHCSPREIEFYLIDFKKGVEFKCYADHRLPHARVIAVESDREFALSVLERVDEELKRRGEIFRKLGVQDLAGYRRSSAPDPLPRSLLLIDEFQEFFVEDDAVAQKASLLFDRIVRQGRAFGIHVLLGSQTLGGAYSLARATIGQMVVRIALQCNEADSYLIMDENNAAPRLLSRPGEGIYNDAAGALEGNSPFQVVWLSDEERDRHLRQITLLSQQLPSPFHPPVVFEGNAPADIRENTEFDSLLAPTAPAPAPATAPRAWLGTPNAIKGPTEVRFTRQSGQHLLIAGQREDAALALIAFSLLALAAQFPIGSAEFHLLHCASPDSTEALFLEQLLAQIPHPVSCAAGNEAVAVMERLGAELKLRTSDDTAAASRPILFLFAPGLHRNRKLRYDEDAAFAFSGSDDAPNPGLLLNELITNGSAVGMHLIASLDSLASVQRCLSRKALAEFEMRVIFQMSANDSASLVDSPQAASLGLHRALYSNQQLGSLETFRPYALPDSAWLAEIGARLRARLLLPPS